MAGVERSEPPECNQLGAAALDQLWLRHLIRFLRGHIGSPLLLLSVGSPYGAMDIGGQKRGFMEWINRAPDGSSADLQRAYGLARAEFPLGVFLHSSFIFLFWFLDQPVMALFNVISSVLLT